MPASDFKLIDVAPDTIMASAFNCVNRDASGFGETSIHNIERATGLSKQMAVAALNMAAQLRLVQETTSGCFKYTGDSSLRLSTKAGFSQFFRAAAQQFPPYLLFLSFCARGFTEAEAASHTASIFGFGLATPRIVSLFGRWSRYAGIMDASGHLEFTPKELLQIGFLRRLAAALNDELSTKTFVINELGTGIAGELYKRGLDLDAIARALVAHSQDPKKAMQDAGNVLEEYLAQSSESLHGPKSDLGKLLDWLQGNSKTILRTHRNTGFGAAGIRNAADHGSDPDTGKPWNLSGEAALVGTLLVMLTIKSIERFVQTGSQEL
jgi:hypothetical protein